ncbi:MAG: FtsX-like permease family protein [Planctomycetes bacterium]|jgi:ABC-type lipoprotein release transport system permease subunit|nr:FtsX-like permease family protein [Planctomycetota bacterium]
MLTLRRLIQRSLTHDARLHLGVAAGVALTCAIITGALGVGDSVRHTLRTTALQRLGAVTHAITPGDRLFLADLAERVPGEGRTMAVLQVPAVVGRTDGAARVNGAQLIGVNDTSIPLLKSQGRSHPLHNLEPGQAVISKNLVSRLGVAPPDNLILRVRKPAALPGELPIDEADDAIALRVTIDDAIYPSQGGRFSLRAEQAEPYNVFVDRAWLAEQLGEPGRANVLLADRPIDVGDALTLADAQLTLRPLAGDRHGGVVAATSASRDGDVAANNAGQRVGAQQLATPRVFIDDATTAALSPLASQRILTYLANTIAHDKNETPYSMVAATDALPDLPPGQIVINQWLADDLGAGVGDKVTLTYYLPDEGAALRESSAAFTVARVVPIEGFYADRALTPDFPGLKDAERFSQWDGGPGIDRSRIREKDEAYWEDYRATPKAFITLADGQRLWANRYGNLTAMRFTDDITTSPLEARLDPEALGFTARDVREQALHASGATVDFGVLFLSLSMFVIVAAGLLTGLLFAFGVEKRATQVGTLRAIGFSPRQVRAWLLGEALAVALLGAIIGLPLGVGYAAGLVALLSGGWQGAVAGADVAFFISPGSLVIGAVGAVVIALLAGAGALRTTMRRPARELLAGGGSAVSEPSKRKAVVALGAAAVALVGALTLILTAPAGTGPKAAGVFFGGGSLLLAAGLLLAFAWLARPRDRKPSIDHRGHGGTEGTETNQHSGVKTLWPLCLGGLCDQGLSLTTLSLSSAARRRGRSLAGAGLIAAGLFIVAAVVGFAPALPGDYTERASGTGGFALFGQTTLPITVDLNTAAGRDRFALEEDELPPGSVVPMRVSDGDDASCLNLNQTPRPRVLGVDPSLLQQRGAFTLSTDDGWAALDRPTDGGAIPALADANTAQWALHVAVGQTLTIERPGGEPITLRLVGTIDNCILQGGLIISEDHFRAAFPAIDGYRMFLLDAPPDAVDARSAVLSRMMEDVGLSLEPALARLARFNAVQATYLTIFQALGALGVTLGCVGLGIVVLRNLLERRAELAMMLALGFARGRVRRVVLIEHLGVLAVGLVIGTAAAGVALGPAWAGGGLDGVLPLGATLLACVLVTAVSVVWATRAALRGRLTDALRGE